jgi:hypothetical protein
MPTPVQGKELLRSAFRHVKVVSNVTKKECLGAGFGLADGGLSAQGLTSTTFYAIKSIASLFTGMLATSLNNFKVNKLEFKRFGSRRQPQAQQRLSEDYTQSQHRRHGAAPE